MIIIPSQMEVVPTHQLLIPHQTQDHLRTKKTEKDTKWEDSLVWSVTKCHRLPWNERGQRPFRESLEIHKFWEVQSSLYQGNTSKRLEGKKMMIISLQMYLQQVEIRNTERVVYGGESRLDVFLRWLGGTPGPTRLPFRYSVHGSPLNNNFAFLSCV